MAPRLRRTLLIALLALLQFVLQPLGTVAWCAVIGGGPDGGCCCGPDGGSDLLRSCCDDDREAPVHHDGGECGCQATPELPPFEPTQAPEVQVQGLGLLGHASLASFQAPDGSQRGLFWPRPRAPGEARPLRLRTRVFRL